MAAGSQLEKGIWALLVIAAIVIRVVKVESWGVENILRMVQCPWLISNPTARRSMESPTRFIRAVIIPAARDFGFWK